MSPNKPEPTEPRDDATDAPENDTVDGGQTGVETTPEPAADTPAAGKPAAPARERGARRGLLLMVLGAAAIAAIAASYVWWQLRNLTGVPAEVALSRVDLAQVSARLESLEIGDKRRARDLDSAIADLAAHSRSLEELSVRSGRIERLVADFPGVADEARTAWLIAEAEYCITGANSSG